MAQQLRKSHKIIKLARDLGIRSGDDPVQEILHYCSKKVKNFLKDFPQCKTLAGLLTYIAAKANTVFEEIRSDEDLRRIKTKYTEAGEEIFATLEEQLSDDTYGITYKRRNRELWEPQFVSVIDCRGNKLFRSYYTKWHEISHLLVLTDQMRLSFRRTYHPNKDPEESLIDIIAGDFAFYHPIINQYKHNYKDISFDTISHLREELCPEASQQASLIGIVKAWSDPCILVHCQKALKKREQEEMAFQTSFDFKDNPIPVLRAVKTTLSEGARTENFRIHSNMRVPEKSIIHRTFDGKEKNGKAKENLSWWKTSGGQKLPRRDVNIETKWFGNSLYALITPTKKPETT